MVAYSFQAGFLPHIVARTKQQTIRLPRKRHARPGEQLQFLTGPRMRPARVGYAVCQSVHEVRLDFDTETVTLDDGIIFADEDTLDRFASRDGFSIVDGAAPARAGLRPWEYMRRWWALTHPGKDVFAGVMIDWGETFTEERPA